MKITPLAGDSAAKLLARLRDPDDQSSVCHAMLAFGLLAHYAHAPYLQLAEELLMSEAASPALRTTYGSPLGRIPGKYQEAHLYAFDAAEYTVLCIDEHGPRGTTWWIEPKAADVALDFSEWRVRDKLIKFINDLLADLAEAEPGFEPVATAATETPRVTVAPEAWKEQYARYIRKHGRLSETLALESANEAWKAVQPIVAAGDLPYPEDTADDEIACWESDVAANDPAASKSCHRNNTGAST
jgi:hypothetical protein